MQLVTLERNGRAEAGVVIDGEVLSLAGAADAVAAARGLPPTLRAIFEAGEGALDKVRRTADAARAEAVAARLRESGALAARDSVTLLAPVPDTWFILSCGMNSRAHSREMNSAPPPHPYGFSKSLTAIIGTGASIVLPASNPGMVDWEGEFSVVIGRRCHNVSAADAMDYVVGYTLVNDVSARDWVAGVRAKAGIMEPILAWDRNILGKQFPTFCPMGPTVATKDEIADIGGTRVVTRLNGEVMQSATMDDLVFGVPELIEYYSRFYVFRPGDIITTGSPPGVGHGRKPPVYMRPGDRIEVSSEAIGTLSNPVVAEAAARR